MVAIGHHAIPRVVIGGDRQGQREAGERGDGEESDASSHQPPRGFAAYSRTGKPALDGLSR